LYVDLPNLAFRASDYSLNSPDVVTESTV